MLWALAAPVPSKAWQINQKELCLHMTFSSVCFLLLFFIWTCNTGFRAHPDHFAYGPKLQNIPAQQDS